MSLPPDTSADAEFLDLNSRVEEISNEISSMKVDLMNILDSNYAKFKPVLESNGGMLEKAECLSEDMSVLQSRVENQINHELANSTGKLQKLKDVLQEKTLSLEIVEHLLYLHHGMINVKREEENSCFVECSRIIKLLKDDLANQNYVKMLDIYVPLDNELVRLYNRIAMKTLDQWKPFINWIELESADSREVNGISLQFTKVESNSSKEQLVQALNNFDLLALEIKTFGSKFLTRVLVPLIESSRVVTVSENGDILTVHCFRKDEQVVSSYKQDQSSYKPGESSHEQNESSHKQQCLQVFSKLTVVFDFIHRHLDIAIGDGITFITELGEVIGDDFCESLNRCLDDAIPKCQKELESYKEVVDRLIEFESLLHQKGLLSRDNHKLHEYAENIDILFANKISQCYLMKARNIMKKDLFNVMEVGVKHEVSGERKSSTVFLTHISPNTFQFPYCQISKSTYELMQLIEDMFQESAIASSELIFRTLYHRSRHILSMYCDIVPLHHKNLLETIPQQSAFFYNNCCYIAHRLATLGVQYRSLLEDVAKDKMEAQKILLFCDLVPTLQATGINVLKNQLNTQKKILIDIVRDSGIVTLMEQSLDDSYEFPKSIEKAIRQCCRQIKLLQNVWQHVLNNDTYCKSIGYLCNEFVDELTERVCSFSDIAEDTAVDLVWVFNIIVEKITSVFEEPGEIYQHVKQWSKFTELIKLLGSSLKEVEERWADGKGPLAQEFSVSQIVHLIRALFTVSTRRSALLSRIK
ncbi:centromere/kinetochore protein zw10 homolog isoform X2 [Nilaparvata lugens]|uniref:centromere/kinetochore protein zw10 homolog isoform X2 n=1 Tax=Nilaparvata lugens TaxID=108931 RepID=UPI00193D5E8E|nr:centromere/kinetochore protein zw10 homolog isoform X2 [Nilaparvata lugens]